MEIVKIRKGKKSDLKEIVRIFIKEFGKSPYNEKWSEKNAFLKFKDYFKFAKCFVAVVDKKVVGFIFADTYYQQTKKLWIYDLVVDGSYQGGGIGKKLIDFAINYFMKKGIDGVRLIASRKAKAFKFYKKLNFKETDFVEMEKKL
ncbi:MAG: GNAT family N-acetyltransferase [Candidatus Pacearchaeota archaeon]|nr:GNAT family N-acetyltransferase [Candidatus Pacearchaeota archaeon]